MDAGFAAADDVNDQWHLHSRQKHDENLEYDNQMLCVRALGATPRNIVRQNEQDSRDQRRVTARAHTLRRVTQERAL